MLKQWPGMLATCWHKCSSAHQLGLRLRSTCHRPRAGWAQSFLSTAAQGSLHAKVSAGIANFTGNPGEAAVCAFVNHQATPWSLQASASLSTASVGYAIAIPSYDREATLHSHTLRVLQQHNVDCHGKVVIFVPNQEEATRYKRALPSDSYSSIQVSRPAHYGIGKQRDYILDYFGSGSNVVMLDDDIRFFSHTYEGTLDLHKAISTGFQLCIQHDCYMWGVNNASNPFYLKPTYSTGWMFIQGPFMGFRVRDGVRLHPTFHEVAEDVQYSLLHCDIDNKVLKLNGIGPKTRPYKTTPGGLQTLYSQAIRAEKSKLNKTWLYHQYSRYIKDWNDGRPHPLMRRSPAHTCRQLQL